MNRLVCPQCGCQGFFAVEQATIRHYAEMAKDEDGISIDMEENAHIIKDAHSTTIGYQCANEDNCIFFIPAHQLNELPTKEEQRA